MPVEGNRKSRSVQELLAASAPIVADGDVQSARLLVDEAETDHPGEPRLLSVVTRCRSLINRGEWLEIALVSLRKDLEEDRFSMALGHFREALNLSRGLKVLKGAVDRVAEEESARLLPRNWRVAETMLSEAAGAGLSFQADSKLQEKLRRVREDEIVTRAIYSAEQAAVEGRTTEARGRLVELQAMHPADGRIRARLQALDHPQGAEIPVDLPSVSKGQAPETPMVSELATEDTLNLTPNGFVEPWRTKLMIEASTWGAIKNFGALAATTLMLGIAGLLIWQHFSQPHARTKTSVAVVPKVKPAKPIAVAVLKTVDPPDEEAWAMVKTSQDIVVIKAFLSTYPASPHALRAKIKLAAIEWANVDKNDPGKLGEYAQQHPKSRYGVEAERLIAESRKTEDSAAVLEAVRVFREGMTEPLPDGGDAVLDEPVVDGDQATLAYHAKGAVGAPQHVFSLIRQDGSWKVRSVR